MPYLFMKRLLVFLFFLSIMSCVFEAKEKALKKLGTESFDPQIWYDANEQERGKMIYDFIKKNSPITDKSRGFIINQLGQNTGYYEYDHFPAYYIGPRPPDSNLKAYLIAFIIDHDSEIVKDIYIHPKIK